MSELTDFRVAVLATDGFEETELTEPVKALKDAGAQVTILSLKPGQIQGVRHDLDKTVKIIVDRAIREASAAEFDAVHLPAALLTPIRCGWSLKCRPFCGRCRRPASP